MMMLNKLKMFLNGCLFQNDMVKMSKTKHTKIGDTIFPIVEINGMTIIDYPPYNPDIAKKVTKEGRLQLEKLSSLMEEYNIKFK